MTIAAPGVLPALAIGMLDRESRAIQDLLKLEIIPAVGSLAILFLVALLLLRSAPRNRGHRCETPR